MPRFRIDEPMKAGYERYGRQGSMSSRSGSPTSGITQSVGCPLCKTRGLRGWGGLGDAEEFAFGGQAAVGDVGGEGLVALS